MSLPLCKNSWCTSCRQSSDLLENLFRKWFSYDLTKDGKYGSSVLRYWSEILLNEYGEKWWIWKVDLI